MLIRLHSKMPLTRWDRLLPASPNLSQSVCRRRSSRRQWYDLVVESRSGRFIELPMVARGDIMSHYGMGIQSLLVLFVARWTLDQYIHHSSAAEANDGDSSNSELPYLPIAKSYLILPRLLLPSTLLPDPSPEVLQVRILLPQGRHINPKPTD